MLWRLWAMTASPRHGLRVDDRRPVGGEPCHRGPQPAIAGRRRVTCGPRPCHYGQGRRYTPSRLIDGPTSVLNLRPRGDNWNNTVTT